MSGGGRMHWPSTFWGGISVMTLSLVALVAAEVLTGHNALFGLLAAGAVLLGGGNLVSRWEERRAVGSRPEAPPAPVLRAVPVAPRQRGKKGARPGKGRKAP